MTAKLALIAALPLSAPHALAQAPLPLENFYGLANQNEAAAQKSLRRIEDGWRNEYAPMLLEIVGFVPSRANQLAIVSLLEKVSGRRFGGSLDDWYEWVWAAPAAEHPDYAEFKAGLYEQIDPRFREYFAGRPLNGVYCTLCGAMILYDVTVQGVHHELGTSGFLYRSNKLMYDHATKSLWSTLGGMPVVGELAGKGIELKTLYVVTTTWGEWRRRHPGTLVLSLETGHRRDYSEGAAYREYFASDRLMFGVPKLDGRLANKAEVLALRSGKEQLAVAADFLRANRVYHDRLDGHPLVVLTDSSGANRVYESGTFNFIAWDGKTVRDAQGRTWKVAEDRLLGPAGKALKRLPAHRAFWFGWYAAYPDTRLVR